MIARLVEAAIAEGLEPHPSWSRQEGLVVDVESGAVSEGEFLTILPQRSGTRAFETPGYLCEKGTNLQPGNPFRDSLAALATRWAAETGHPLPVAVASFLRAGRAIPEDPRWVAFGLGGKTCADFPELHPLVWAAVAPEEVGEPEPCVGCGRVRRAVALHDGVSAMGNAAPVLVSWNRGAIVDRGRRRGGENLPTCAECMYLYVGWLNKHIKYDHRHGMHTFMIDGQEWRLGSNVRAGFVCEVVPHSIVADLWGEAERAQRATRENKMSKAARDKWGEKLAAVDRVFAETNDDNYMLGYMYGVLEWAASVVRVPCPTMTDVVAAPARHVAPLVVACHDGATRYTPPPKERGRPSNVFPPTSAKSVVKAWLDHVLTLSTARLSSLRAAPLGVEELPAFALGYAHSLRERGPRRERLDDEGPINGHDPTPWAIRLASGLRDRGVEVKLEHPVKYRRAGEDRDREYRIDVAVVGQKFAIEVDGRLRGLSTRDHVKDSRKSAVLQAQGWRLHRVPNARLNRPDDVAEVVDEVCAILAAIPASVGVVGA